MQNTTLLEHYTILQHYDVAGFATYLNYRHSGGNGYVPKMHNIIQLYIEEGNEDKLNLEELEKFVFNKPFANRSNIRNYVNKLQNNIKEYVILLKTQDKNTYTEILWGEILIEHQAQKSLKIKQALFQNDYYTEEYSFMRNYFHIRETIYQVTMRTGKIKDFNLVTQSYATIDAFNEYELMTKLEYYLTIVNTINQKKHAEHNFEAKSINRIIKDALKTNNPLLHIYARQLALSIDNVRKNYINLKKIFYELEEYLPIHLKNNFASILLNFCYTRMHQGITYYRKETYQFLKELKEKNILFSSYFFTHLRLNNYILLELEFGTIDRANQILSENINKVASPHRHASNILNQARILFASGEYAETIKLLKLEEHSIPAINTATIKTLYLLSHIMLNDRVSVDIERKQFYDYVLKSKDLSANRRKRYIPFVKLTPLLSEAKYQELSYYAHNKLQEALNSSEYFTEKDWVMKRFQYLSKKYPRLRGRKVKRARSMK